MKNVIVWFIVISIVFGWGIALAAEKKQSNTNNPTGTIVGSELMQNRYEYVDPTETPKDRPPVVQKLLDKGVFTAIEDKRSGAQPVVNQKNN